MAWTENVNLTVTTGKYEVGTEFCNRSMRLFQLCVSVCLLPTHSAHSALMSPARSHWWHCILLFGFGIGPYPRKSHMFSAANRRVECLLLCFPFVYLKKKRGRGKRAHICISVYETNGGVCRTVYRNTSAHLTLDDFTRNLRLKLWSGVYVPWHFGAVTSLSAMLNTSVT